VLIKPDPATPQGEAIIDLADLMDGLLADAGEWPGADTVSILEGWLSRFTFAVSETFTPQVAGRAWVLRQWDRYGDDVTLWSDEASALAALAREVRASWDDVAGIDDVPCRPPACCPAPKMPMTSAFTVPMFGDDDAPPAGARRGGSSARCRCRRRGAGWLETVFEPPAAGCW
jgi:hypothetical protein